MKKKLLVIISIVTIIAIFIICVESIARVCEVIYTDDIEREYENIVSRNDDMDCILIRSQVVTEGTEYYVEQSTNPILIESGRNIILYDWINPSFLRLNNSFSMSGQVKYVVMISKNDVIEKENKYDEKVVRVKPKRVIMLTQSAEIYSHSRNGTFYVKDLSLLGHIRFYVGRLVPSLRESI